ncbi:MAG: transposase [Chloroflexota bacterium]
MERKNYPSDVSDDEWAFVAPYLTLMKEDAPQRDYALREVFNGLRYMVRSGGGWRLMPHDCRHYWATRAASQGTDPFALQEAGGWNSLAMPRRYIEAGKIANDGVRL